MKVTYNTFTSAFLAKVTAYDFLVLDDYARNSLIDSYMKWAIADFKHICKHDLTTTGDDIIREFSVDIPDEDVDELVDIVSDGMLVQWLKQYVYRQEGLESVLNTKDFTTYSPAELLYRINESFKAAKSNYTNAKREYSYNHGDLTVLHL